MDADRTAFSYSMKIRAGELAQAGYQYLNRRDLPWVFFRFRFDATDGQLKTRLNLGPSLGWDGPDDRDYSTAPTFFLYRRVYSGGYQMHIMPGFPIHQSLLGFLRVSPRLPGGGPYYPALP